MNMTQEPLLYTTCTWNSTTFGLAAGILLVSPPMFSVVPFSPMRGSLPENMPTSIWPMTSICLSWGTIGYVCSRQRAEPDWYALGMGWPAEKRGTLRSRPRAKPDWRVTCAALWERE